MREFLKRILILPIVFFLLLSAPAGAKKPPSLKKAGVYCVILPYNFDREEKGIPVLDLPDNALLLLQGLGGDCEPAVLSVEQEGEVLPAAGWESFYIWGAFRVVYFPPEFDKFSGYKLRFTYRDNEGEIEIVGGELKYLAKGAQKGGRKKWEEPVTRRMIERIHPVELAGLLSRGRGTEYANLALGIVQRGGLPLLRREARGALMSGDNVKAACMASMAIKWAPAYETQESRRVPVFQDWVLVARAFKNMDKLPASIKAYDEALKVYRDPRIVSEREKIIKKYKSRSRSASEFKPGLTEMERAAGKSGSIPIPEPGKNEIKAGVSANGIYLDDHRDRVLAQCGEPDERLSTVLLYTDHRVCPEAVFISPSNLVYSIRTSKGQTKQGISSGTELKKVKESLGEPENTELLRDTSGNETGTRWIYTELKMAFLDLNDDGKVDQVEVFDYSLID